MSNNTLCMPVKPDMKRKAFIHHRYSYHLRCSGDPPQTWRHWECDASDGSPPIEFELFWVPHIQVFCTASGA